MRISVRSALRSVPRETRNAENHAERTDETTLAAQAEVSRERGTAGGKLRECM